MVLFKLNFVGHGSILPLDFCNFRFGPLNEIPILSALVVQPLLSLLLGGESDVACVDFFDVDGECSHGD